MFFLRPALPLRSHHLKGRRHSLTRGSRIDNVVHISHFCGSVRVGKSFVVFLDLLLFKRLRILCRPDFRTKHDIGLLRLRP